MVDEKISGNLIQSFSKINLYLEIKKKLSNGYHEIDSLSVFTDIHDNLTFRSSNNISLVVNGDEKNKLGDTHENIIIKAAKLIQEILKIDKGIAITLDKRIPVAARLGGGSSNAAVTIQECVKLWKPKEKIKIDSNEIAYKLGADIPFFLKGSSALVGGIGEKVYPLNFFPKLYSIIVNPKLHISTNIIYSSFKGPFVTNPSKFSNVKQTTNEDLFAYLNRRKNCLTNIVIQKEPIVRDVLDLLCQTHGAELVRMSGSGPTCFALYSNRQDMDIAYNFIYNKRPNWWIKKSQIRLKVS